MKVPRRPLTLTKEQAAVRQVEAAIHALMRGDFDIAVTLACAAEGMFKRAGRHLFAVLRDHPTAKGIPKKVWIAHLNRDRDWLKHHCGPDRLVIERSSAAAAITRAATKLEAEDWTPLIDAYREWHNANIEEIIAE
jgi:hypothetical protein